MTSERTATKGDALSHGVRKGPAQLAGKYATQGLEGRATEQGLDHSLASGRGHEHRSAATEAELFDKQGVEAAVTDGNTKTSLLGGQSAVPGLSKSGTPLHIQFDASSPNFGNQTERAREGPIFAGSDRSQQEAAAGLRTPPPEYQGQSDPARQGSQFPAGRPHVPPQPEYNASENQSLGIRHGSAQGSSGQQAAPDKADGGQIEESRPGAQPS